SAISPCTQSNKTASFQLLRERSAGIHLNLHSRRGTQMGSERILIVEDDEGLRQVTHVQLEREGYEVSSAVSAEQAIPILEKAPHQLILTDLNLPGVSGLDLLKRIRVEYPESAVIVMTAFGTVQTAVEAMKAGAYDYINKPVHPYE